MSPDVSKSRLPIGKPPSRVMPGYQSGLGLPATVFLISILAIIVVAMSELNETSVRGFGQDFHSQKAFYAAESGAQVALNRIFVGGVACSGTLAAIDYDASGTNPGLDNCSVDLNCDQVDVDGLSYYTVTSTATCGSGFEQARRSIQVRARSD